MYLTGKRFLKKKECNKKKKGSKKKENEKGRKLASSQCYTGANQLSWNWETRHGNDNDYPFVVP
jgi:hypothetical protein